VLVITLFALLYSVLRGTYTLKQINFEKLKQIVGEDLAEYKPVAGVYFLLKEDVVVYVGQAKDVGARIAAHVLQKQGQFDRIVFQKVEDFATRLEREKHYIRAWRPVLNIALNKDKQELYTNRYRESKRRGLERYNDALFPVPYE
jgi:excinuclease UvrABC nuclease subunit